MDGPLKVPGLLFILLWFAIFPHASVQAQATSLEPGVPVEGRAGEDASVWQFVGQTGALLSFLAEPLESDLDPVLTIRASNGDVLISNDDYDYPNTRAALIEGFSVPRPGNYTVTVSGHAGTQGAYRLTMMPGYSTVQYNENFNGNSAWSIPASAVSFARSEVLNGQFILDVEGVNQFTNAIGGVSLPQNFFARTLITQASGRNGWIAGLAFRMQGADRYYALEVNQRGFWRVIAQNGETTTTLREWSSHPGIPGAPASFSLGVLGMDNSYEFFFNDIALGSIVAEALTRGELGLRAGTTNAIGSNASIRFDDVWVTQPRQVSSQVLFPYSLVPGNRNDIIRDLQRRLVIPGRGELFFTLSDSAVRNNAAGVWRFPLARGESFGNFAMGATFTWQVNGPGPGGCGLIVRENNAENSYVLAFADNGGGMGLAIRVEDEFLNTLYQEQAVPTGSISIVVVGLGDIVHLWVQNQYVGFVSVPNPSGTINTAIVNYEPQLTECSYRDIWLWRW